MAKLQIKKSSVFELLDELSQLHTKDTDLQTQIGSLGNLETTFTDNLVGSLNEINTLSHSNKQRLNFAESKIGINDVLTTDEQTIVFAINENKSRLDGLDTFIGVEYTLVTEQQNVVSSINEIHEQVDNIDSIQQNEILRKDDNLESLFDKESSRQNLVVYSKTEVDEIVTNSALNLGSNYTIQTISDLASIDNLTNGDNIFVKDNGDNKWAIYKVVEANDGNGANADITIIMDEDVYLNAVSKETIKTTYESNANTNAFTDVEKTKVSYITITNNINLDKVIQNDELNTSITLDNVSDFDIASSLAIKTFINNKNANNLKISNNFGDLSDKPVARDNLEVYSRTEIDELFSEQSEAINNTNKLLSWVEKAKKNHFFGLDLLGKI